MVVIRIPLSDLQYDFGEAGYIAVEVIVQDVSTFPLGYYIPYDCSNFQQRSSWKSYSWNEG